MSLQVAARLAIEPLRSLSAASLSGVYTPIGAPLLNPSRKLLIQNYTNGLVVFSDNGITDKFVLAAGAQIILDEALNHQGDYTAQGTIFYVAGIASTTGEVYLSTWYGAS